MAVLDIERAIAWLLTSDSNATALNAIRGTRCRPGSAAPNDALPYQVYSKTDGGDDGHMGGGNATEASAILIESYAATRSELIALMDATRTATHGKGPVTIQSGSDTVEVYEITITHDTRKRRAASGEESIDQHHGTQTLEVWHQMPVSA